MAHTAPASRTRLVLLFLGYVNRMAELLRGYTGAMQETEGGSHMRLKVTVLILCELLVLVRGGMGRQAKFEPDLNNAYGFLQACIEVDKASSPYDWLSVNQAAFFCLGYVSGMASALDDDGVIELPNHVQPGVIREVVVKYLRDHAESLSESTSSLVHRALLDAWGRKVRKQR